MKKVERLLSWLYPSTLEIEAVRVSETLVNFIGLHGVISKKKVLFIVTALKTSYPIYKVLTLQRIA
jgi:hypothetical protein